MPNDQEGAITAARALFESICKLILDDSKITYDNNDDLPRLYRKVVDSLNLAPEKQLNDTIRRIFGGTQTIISGIAEMRNQLGDAHGKGQQIALPESRYATLAVNLAGTLAVFLIERWQAKVNEKSKMSL